METTSQTQPETPAEPPTFLPHEEGSPPSDAVATAPRPARVLYGGILLFAALGAALALALAYTPMLTGTPPEINVAAVDAAQKEDLFKNLSIAAKGVYVYDVARGTELFAKAGNQQLPLASITKVALILAIAEVLPLDGTVTISREAVEKGEGGLTWGEEWRVRDLIDYTLITSSNTGAEALAEAADPLLRVKYPTAPVGGAAVWRMNGLAQELEMQETYFINATGLDESTTQAGALGSAHDIATLFAYALRTNVELFSGTTKSDMPLAPLNFPERDARNTNNALAEIAGIRMGKTGTTDLAGGNLAIAFDAESNRSVIIVVLGSSTLGRYEDIVRLVDAARRTVIEE